MDVWRLILLERLGVRRHIQIEHNASRGLRAVITAIDLTDSVLVTGTSLADLESKLIKETAL